MDKTQLEELIAKGLTQPEIGVELGKSTASVARALKKHGLKTKRFIDHDPEAKHRTCRYCNKKQKIESFSVCVVKNDVEYRRHKCDDCYNDTKNGRRHRNRDWLNSLKAESGCRYCGTKDFRVLDYHHLSDKLFNVADSIAGGFAKEKILNEVAKCEVLCSNCHRILTYDECH